MHGKNKPPKLVSKLTPAQIQKQQIKAMAFDFLKFDVSKVGLGNFPKQDHIEEAFKLAEDFMEYCKENNK